MTEVSLVGAAAVHALSCPYCHRPMPPDADAALDAQHRWGFAAAQAVEDGRVVGLLVLAPAETGATVACGWVEPDFVRRGVGRQLVRAAAAGLVAQRVGSLAALSGHSSGCAGFSRRWLAAVGFRPTTQPKLWRMDLNQTVLVPRRTLRETFEELVDAVRPVPPPEPVGRTGER